MSVTDPLREEHRQLLPSIEELKAAGDAVGFSSLPAQREKANAAYAFLTEHLIPHAEAEDEFLYPEIDRLVGTRGGTRATDTMRRDHLEVARLTARLGELRKALVEGEPTAEEQRELRSVLYGLHTLIGVHFAKEEEVYLPLLDRELTEQEAHTLFAQMGHGEHVSSGPGQAPSGSPTHSAEERQ